jgi:hypothetical protein
LHVFSDDITAPESVVTAIYASYGSPVLLSYAFSAFVNGLSSVLHSEEMYNSQLKKIEASA